MALKAFISLISLCLVSGPSIGQIDSRIKQMAYADSARLVSMFMDLHQHPELGFMEIRTSGIIAKELKAIGYEVTTGIGKTGVVGLLRNGNGPTVMFRADMDCNSVKEVTGLPYASTKTMKKEDGTETAVMHACGHDAHVTWMLGIAKIMMALKKEWKGTLLFLGQPAEEPMTGALAMVNDGLFTKGIPVPDILIGMHTASDLAVGKVINGAGVRMAGSDQLDVTFYGRGAHGSAPQDAKDPVVMACNAVLLYQTIISRSIAAQEVAVLTVGAIQAGIDNNVIPASALLKLNLRWFNEKTRNIMLDGINKINEGIAVANGLGRDQYPLTKMKGKVFPLENNAGLTNEVNRALAAHLTSENIITDKLPAMYSEDFQNLIYGNKKTISDYITIGTGNPKLYARAMQEGKVLPFNHHAGDFVVDIAAIPLGTEIGVVVLLAVLKR